MHHRPVCPSAARAVVLSAVTGIVLLATGIAVAAKPEDVFKGQIVITKERLPARFASAQAFISAVQSKRTDKIWPTEEKGPEQGTWNLEYIGFFAQPLTDNELQVKFYDVTSGPKRYVAGDPQYTRERGARIFSASIQLAKPEFDVNKKYMMTMESGHRIIATTTFWLRGKGAQYSGKVEFSDEEARKR